MIQICIWIQQMILAGENPFKSQGYNGQCHGQVDRSVEKLRLALEGDAFKPKIIEVTDFEPSMDDLASKICTVRSLLRESNLDKHTKQEYENLIFNVEKASLENTQNSREFDYNPVSTIQKHIETIQNLIFSIRKDIDELFIASSSDEEIV